MCRHDSLAPRTRVAAAGIAKRLSQPQLRQRESAAQASQWAASTPKEQDNKNKSTCCNKNRRVHLPDFGSADVLPNYMATGGLDRPMARPRKPRTPHEAKQRGQPGGNHQVGICTRLQQTRQNSHTIFSRLTPTDTSA
jgi:hypothetical protein